MFNTSRIKPATHTTMPTRPQTYPARQRGIVLPIALVLLLVTTLVGVTSLRSNSVSEKMTRNTIQRDVAFSKAETALIEGEEIARNNAPAIKAAIVGVDASDTCDATVTINGAAEVGFCSPSNFPQTAGATPTTVERWQIPDIWSDTAPVSYIENADGSKIIIEFMGHILNSDNDVNCGSAYVTTWPYCDADGYQFRITALAEGDANNNARVMLQSTYVVSP
ncbi:MAG: PilX N-terminal domain-containing pilus assembly protein [Pseudomonadota bacterium]